MFYQVCHDWYDAILFFMKINTGILSWTEIARHYSFSCTIIVLVLDNLGDSIYSCWNYTVFIQYSYGYFLMFK